MDVREIVPGLWYWTAPHPDWNGAADWPEDVGCVYYEAPNATVFIDPLVAGDRKDDLWAEFDTRVQRRRLPVQVLLTAPWHMRSAPAFAERYGAAVWGYQTGGAPAGALPAGTELFVPGGASEGQVGFFLRPHRALVVAEVFMGVDGGLRVCPSPGLIDAHAFNESLRGLLDLPIDHVIVSHGAPVLHNGRRQIAEALGVHV